MNKLVAADWGSVLAGFRPQQILVKRLRGLTVRICELANSCPKNSIMQITLIDLLSRCIVHLVVTRLAERVTQPFESFVETITGCSASRLDVLYETISAY